jgi:hypothetical protein
MKAFLRKASDWEFEQELNNVSLETILKIIETSGHEVILGKDRYDEDAQQYTDDLTIMIYDDYVE